MFKIESISVENLRGYEKTTLNFEKMVVLVGENNVGKSSALKMLERLFLFEDSFWSGARQLSDPDYDFWYPANDAKHRARRFSLGVRFLDGRYAKRFNAEKNSLIWLRLAIDTNGVCRLNLGVPRRNEVHEEKAVELLRKLKDEVRIVLLPPIRDAGSSSFAAKVTKEVKQALLKKIGHNSRAGAPKEYRLAKEAIQKIREIVALHQGELKRSADSPLASMLRASEVRVEIFPKDLYDLVDQSMFVYLSTGSHDENKVLPQEVGNGLQSLIDINLTVESILNDSSAKNVILIIEEPEAFLHPSAQRQFMQYLRRALVDRVQSAILTTHSPIVLDEAHYEEIVLVRNHKHFAPAAVTQDRSSINTSLMTTASSEIFFARTVVLVEGEGDKAFFNTLLRRIKRSVPVSAELSGLVLHPTGGCTFYAPWLKLVRCYRNGNVDAIDCVWIMDGDAATGAGERPVLRAAKDCAFGLNEQDKNDIVEFGDRGWEIQHRTPRSVDDVNRILTPHGGHLFSCDFEWALFNGASDKAVERIRSVMEEVGISTEGTRVELARRLGSKIGTGKAADGAKKQPFIRALIAERLEPDEIPPEIRQTLTRILKVAMKSDAAAKEVQRTFGI